MNQMEKELKEVTVRQAYEWVKTGHWSLKQFQAWCNNLIASHQWTCSC